MTESPISHLPAALTGTGVYFCVWAPQAQTVEVVFDIGPEILLLRKDSHGYFRGIAPGRRAGALYRYSVDGKGPYPDPRSRFQPQGVHGPSMVVDPQAHLWSDTAWAGVEMKGQVIYELHIGTFTREGTFDAAIAELDELKALGITLIEVMPVAEFPGRWNWGYDGVQLYAPFHGYGDYNAFKRFVDAAHRRGLGVILDVVYNHLGPDGNYLACYSPHYFTDRYKNEWGEAINFDGPHSGAVRDFFIDNARYWIGEFHLDGLRLDATQSIHDSSRPHILAQIACAAREAAGSRRIVLIAENEPQDAGHLLPVEQGGFGLDALWNDDLHHSARVALTGRSDGYFHDHRGTAQEFVSAAKRGFLFQGQYYHWQKQPRGTPITAQPAWCFVNYLQNHDQVANTFYGERLNSLSSPGRIRAMTALLLLAPQTPMLFMGQEFGTQTLFTFFADHKPELRAATHAGRRKFVAQFDAYAGEAAQARILDPAARETFEASRLNLAERQRNAAMYSLHKDLLRIRREDPVIAAQDRFHLDGAVLSETAFVLRWFAHERSGGTADRLLVVNLGRQLALHPAPEPLLAPPMHSRWTLQWSGDDPKYDGPGVVMPCGPEGWCLPGESAVLLRSTPDATTRRA